VRFTTPRFSGRPCIDYAVIPTSLASRNTTGLPACAPVQPAGAQATSCFDVNLPFQIAALDALGGKARLQGLPRKGPQSGRNPSFHLRAKWPSPPGPVFRFSGAEVVSEATAVSNIAEKRVCGKRVLSKLRSSKIALATSNNFKVA
jgi:hypothetical protein